MRVTRALWASLGAGTSMVLVGAAVLAVVSTVVAFHGWPGAVSATVAPPRAMLPEAQAAPITPVRTASPRVVVPDAPAPPRRAVAERTDSAADRAPARVRAVAPAEDDRGTGVAPAPTTGNAVVARPQPAPQDEPAPAEPVRKLGSEVGASTEQTVSDLGTSVDPLSPTLGQVVDDVGQVVGDTVEGITNTTADLLDGLVARRP